MKYRVQMEAVFNNSDSNDILNHIESVKASVYKAEYFTPVYVNRLSKKLENTELEPTEYVSVDFDGSEEAHLGTNTGTEFKVLIDVSFSANLDLINLLNYIESIKSNAINTYNRSCRYFECKHEELVTPLPKDGAYGYINFDGEVVNH